MTFDSNIDPGITHRVSSFPAETVARVARKLFLGVSREWELSPDEQQVLLGLECGVTVAGWLHATESPLSAEVLLRISILVGCWMALGGVLPSEQQSHWMKAENAAFHGHSPLSIMLSQGVAGMSLVRNYLEAQRHVV